MSSVACLVSPFSFVHVISQIPDADTVALRSCALLSCVATRASAFDDEGVSASAVADGARLACATIVATPHNKIGITHNNFILFSNSRQSNYRMLSAVSMFWNPPTREEFGDAQLFGPGAPLGFELSNDIRNTNLQEFARHMLLRVCNVVIAIWKDPHPDEPAGSCRGEIACGEGSSSGVRRIEDGEGERVQGPGERIGTGRTEVPGIFVQEGTRQKLGSVSGRMICHAVSIVPAECASAIFPFPGIFARGIEHSQSRPKSGQNDGWWTEGFMGVYMKFILNCKRSSGQSRRQNWELIQVCFGDCRRRWRLFLRLVLLLMLRHWGIGESGKHRIIGRGLVLFGLLGHR